jgi:protein ImuB
VFAVLSVPDFSLQAVLRQEPELRSGSIALVDAAGPNLARTLVLECTAPARDAGVCAGLSAPQAMARCRELILKPRSLSAEQSATDILLQTAYAFSPHLEHTAPGVITIDLRGLDFGGSGRSDISGEAESPAPPGSRVVIPKGQQRFEFFDYARMLSSLGGETRNTPSSPLLAAWATEIITVLQKLGLDARVGMAVTPNIALLAAQAARPILVVTDTETFFRQLPIEALQPSSPVLDILKRWGIQTAGEFLALGKDAIAGRLGGEALELFDRASPAAIRPLNIVVPPNRFEEQMQFEAQIETIEPLLFVLRRFIDQLATRIGLTYRVVAELDLVLTLESGLRHERAFKVPSPTANQETLFRMLHTHLESLRTDAPIVALELGAVPIRPEAQQFGLFESALRDPNHFHETLARLTALLGAERVGTPVIEQTHRPDSFRMQTPDFHGRVSTSRAESHQANGHAGLCLRRFREPVPAEVEFRDGHPFFFSTAAIGMICLSRPRVDPVSLGRRPAADRFWTPAQRR